MRVLQLTRDNFLENYWDWQPGEHVNLIEPTGGGKSHLLYQLLNQATRHNPGLSVATLMPKPIDPTTEQWKRQLKFGETERWPPERWPWQSRPPGLRPVAEAHS
jgi:ABC-type molybdenum transport system ATPase subunit/photorepair protein PhrA